jgi:hypothetical protein
VVRKSMSVSVSQVLELLGRLVAGSADCRGTAADTVSDWTRTFDGTEAAIISRVLLWLALVETDDTAREAQLHALAELAEFDLAPDEVLRDVGQLSRAELHGSSIEHFDYLRSLRTDES